MMLAILVPVLAFFDKDDPARIGIAMSVPFAANVGGLGTPIGTPPNAVAMKYLTGDMAVSFGGWMAFAVPYVILLLIFTWGTLLFFFRPAASFHHVEPSYQHQEPPLTQQKLASLGQLASGMAHEIHNPLSIISGEAQLYLERSKGQDEKVDEVLTSIIEECQRAADITRRILRFAKPAPSDLAALDLKAVIDESLALAGYQVRLEHVERVVIADGLSAHT